MDMTLRDTDIAKVRTVLLCLAGLSCLLYAVLAIAQNVPQPIWWFVPMAMGVLAGVGWCWHFCGLRNGNARGAAYGKR